MQQSIPPYVPLRGSDEPSNFWSHDQDGNISDGRAGVVTIYTYKKSGSPVFIGTGFYIAQGIVATARHVIEAFQPGEYAMVAELKSANGVSLRRVHEVCVHRDSDVGILRVLAELQGETNHCLVLGARKPGVTDLAYTLSCANSQIISHGEKYSISVHYEYFRGAIVDQFPTGRDRVMLSWPSYQVNFHIHGGASGGPVFEKTGTVFAINTSSHEPETDIAFVTSVDMLLGCIVNNINIEGKYYKTATIGDLAAAGIVRYE